MTVYLRYADRVDGPFDSAATAERWAFDNNGNESFTTVTWAELTEAEVVANDLAEPEVAEPFYVRYPSGRTAGPFEDAGTADGWARDQGGPEARSYEVLDADEYAGYAGTHEAVIQIRVKVSGLANDPDEGWSEEPIEAVLRVFDRANDEGFAPYTFEVVS